MLLQFVFNGIISGSLIAIMAIGFWFIYRAINLFHIAHGAVYTVSAYIFYSLYASRGNPLPLAFLLSLISGAILGLAMYFAVYRPLEKKSASAGIKFISSLAIYIFVVNVIALIYGNETKIFSEGISDSLNFSGIILTKIQLYQFLSLLILFILSYFFVQGTKAGRAIRAIGDNPLLFKAIGLNERWTKGMVFCIGSAIAAIASILTGLDVGIDPHIGMFALLNAIVAVIIGGVKKLEGVVLGAFLIGIMQNVFIWQFSARWESAVTFLILVIVLLYKSGGLFIVRRRVEEL
ncbi:MAG: branched-chain amino acid ABC transporter permease [Nitrospirota bacterium]